MMDRRSGALTLAASIDRRTMRSTAMNRNLLLISNSQQHGFGYMEHCLPAVDAFLGTVRTMAFVPFALQKQETYGERVAATLRTVGVSSTTVTPDAAGLACVRSAEAVFVGGGNTWRLLRILRETGILDALRRRARDGMPYVGSSAGTNLACPTIRTTNDMPIVEPGSFEALGLLPFQINPHYLDPDPNSTHRGETREQRILEFLEENDRVVVGLREGGWIRVRGHEAVLEGSRPARIFRRDREPEEREAGSDLSDLLAV